MYLFVSFERARKRKPSCKIMQSPRTYHWKRIRNYYSFLRKFLKFLISQILSIRPGRFILKIVFFFFLILPHWFMFVLMIRDILLRYHETTVSLWLCRSLLLDHHIVLSFMFLTSFNYKKGEQFGWRKLFIRGQL